MRESSRGKLGEPGLVLVTSWSQENSGWGLGRYTQSLQNLAKNQAAMLFERIIQGFFLTHLRFREHFEVILKCAM